MKKIIITVFIITIVLTISFISYGMFSKNKIPHERNKSYPNSKHLADWILPEKNIFVEYFGLARDSKRYDETIKLKRNICRKSGIKLIEIYPENVYPVLSLDKILKRA